MSTNGENLLDYNYRVGLSPKRMYKLDKLVGRDVRYVSQWEVESEEKKVVDGNETKEA